MQQAGLGYLLLIFAGGMVGSFHCVGMCGGFACALGADRAGRAATAVRHLLYNTGRVTTYVFLGALAGAAGAGLVGLQLGVLTEAGQRLLAAAAGAVMVLIALPLVAPALRGRAVLALWAPGALLPSALQALLRARARSAALALGVFNGFLPCPLVYAFAALALASAAPSEGALLMLAFGLGTFPAMLLMGGAGVWLSERWLRGGVRFAGALVLVLGVLTIARAVVPFDGHGVHMPVTASGHASGAATVIDHGHHR
jgi:uncharacterized protein